MSELRLSDPTVFHLWAQERATGIPTDPHYFLRKRLQVVQYHLAQYQALAAAVPPLLKETLRDWLVEVVFSSLVDTPISYVIRVGGGTEQEFVHHGLLCRLQVRVVKVENHDEAIRLVMEFNPGIEFLDVVVSREKIRIKDWLSPFSPSSTEELDIDV